MKVIVDSSVINVSFEHGIYGYSHPCSCVQSGYDFMAVARGKVAGCANAGYDQS